LGAVRLGRAVGITMTDILPIIVGGVISGCAAIAAVIATYILARRREHEADWRKLKFAQYQEFVLALSGIVNERSTPQAQARYSDAVNSMGLIAPPPVLRALRTFQAEISYANRNRSDERHDRLLDPLFRAMRADIQPRYAGDPADYQFGVLGVPPRN
jgi:hypothetical protein